jgi:hypothetical protein
MIFSLSSRNGLYYATNMSTTPPMDNEEEDSEHKNDEFA